MCRNAIQRTDFVSQSKFSFLSFFAKFNADSKGGIAKSSYLCATKHYKHAAIQLYFLGTEA